MHNAEHYSSQLFQGGTSSTTGMAAVVIAIAHKHMFRFKEQSMLTSTAVFAYHLPRIGIFNGNNFDQTGFSAFGKGEQLINGFPCDETGQHSRLTTPSGILAAS